MHRSLTTSTLARLAAATARRATIAPVLATRPTVSMSPSISLSLQRFASSSAAALAPTPRAQDIEDEGEEDPDSGADDFGPENRTPFATVESNMHPNTFKAITKTSYKHTDMSPVQDAVLSLLPELAEPYNAEKHKDTQRDLLVRAKTGTGKTLAFLVPAIEARLKTLARAGESSVLDTGLKGDARMEKPLTDNASRHYAMKNVGTLIISPTRELATQIANAALKLSRHHDFHVQLFVGGESKGLQMKDWSRGRKDILVATPGRFLDMVNSNPAIAEALKNINTLVLDEADTLLDMGFRADIEKIISYLPPPPVRQTLLFSATVSAAIRQVVQSTMSKNFGYINCVNETDSPVHAHIPQYFTALPSGADQIAHLVRLIAQDQLLHPELSKIILFCNTTKTTQLVTDALRTVLKTTFPDSYTQLWEIHSKKSQDQRTRVSEAFRRAQQGSCILVTSDVSARGVDYPDVTRVIQLGIPASSTQYIHRVGRTGRGRNTEGRGDLVLLPFEKTFVQYQLSEVPIKNAGVNDVESQLLELADQYDANPQSFIRSGGRENMPRTGTRFVDRRYGFQQGPKIPFGKDLRQRMDNIADSVKSGLATIPPETVTDAFGAVLGFYSSLRQDLRCRGSDLLQGIEAWIREAYEVDPPHLSQDFKKKLGLVDGYDAVPRRGQRDRDRPRRVGGFQGGRGSEWGMRSSSGSREGFRPRWAKDENDSGSGRGYGRPSPSSSSYGGARPRFGGDRFGGDRLGGDRFGGDRFGGDRSGSRSAPGQRQRSRSTQEEDEW